ncbi:MAG: SurA N-terminal domain-containing protein, partial [Anaerolinea sp.]|nr:SurA N-terminal domain-containing protein [Anaerolinea sp.]
SMGTPNALDGDPTAAPTGPDGLPAAAVVNDVLITRTEYDRAYERFQMQMGVSDPGELRALVLNMLIEQALIEQAAAGQGLTVTDEAIDAEIARARQLAGSDEAWAAWLAQNRYTESEFRETLRDALLTGLMRDAVTQDLNGLWLQANARHILVASAEEAHRLIERLRAGEDFAALAGQYSLDITTRQNGGELGWFLPGELLEPALDRAAFQNDIGLSSAPIQSSLGYHVFEVLGREQRPVDDDRRAILAQSRFEAWLDNLAAAARIQIYV